MKIHLHTTVKDFDLEAVNVRTNNIEKNGEDGKVYAFYIKIFIFDK